VRVGFIGLGVMGGRMARHVAGRYGLTVFDVDAAKVAALEAAVLAGGAASSGTGSSTGARGATSVAAVGAASDLVLVSLPSSEIVERVVTGDGGLLSHMGSGGAVIDTSTTEPVATRRIAATLAERGIGFLDAPVSGGQGAAEAATLSIMVGGPAELFDRCKPVLDVLGPSVVRVGEVGAGEVAKLVNNMIVGATFAVIAESFALGKKMGLDLEQLYQAIRGGWAGSAVLDVAAPGIVRREFTPGGSVDLLFKDLGYALGLARSENVPTPMTAVADEIFKAARASGRGPQAQHVIIQLWEELLGLE
jgi:2-hydroxy-3-oxopropionate reductase